MDGQGSAHGLPCMHGQVHLALHRGEHIPGQTSRHSMDSRNAGQTPGNFPKSTLSTPSKGRWLSGMRPLECSCAAWLSLLELNSRALQKELAKAQPVNGSRAAHLGSLQQPLYLPAAMGASGISLTCHISSCAWQMHHKVTASRPTRLHPKMHSNGLVPALLCGQQMCPLGECITVRRQCTPSS